MYKEMRRKDRQITKEEALALLEKGEYGFLSTTGSDGQPYGIPLNYIVADGTIYFHCAKTGQKVDNFVYEPRVSFCTVGETQPVYENNFTTYFESAVVFGKVSPVEDLDKKTDILMKLCEKYLPAHMDKARDSIRGSIAATAVYGIRMDHITGKAKKK